LSSGKAQRQAKTKKKDKTMARGKIKNVSLVKTADTEQSNTWEFPVYQEELITARGVKSGIHAVIREDTQAVIGQYKGIKALPYTDIVERFEDTLSNNGLQFTRSLMTTSNGGRFWGRYDIGNGVHVGAEKFGKILRLQSSHDGSLTPGFSLEMERLVCLNGMVGMAEVFALFQRHSTTFDLGFISNNVMQAIESGTTYALQTVEQMSNLSINDSQARNIVSNIVTLGNAKGVSPKTGHLIYNNWQNPTRDEVALGDTLYRLYNATTRLTRDIANVGRFEMSRKANVFVTGAFDLAVRGKHNLEKLLANPATPLEFDAVIVNN
jgi:hypothetical protein